MARRKMLEWKYMEQNEKNVEEANVGLRQGFSTSHVLFTHTHMYIYMYIGPICWKNCATVDNNDYILFLWF